MPFYLLLKMLFSACLSSFFNQPFWRSNWKTVLESKKQSRDPCKGWQANLKSLWAGQSSCLLHSNLNQLGFSWNWAKKITVIQQPPLSFYQCQNKWKGEKSYIMVNKNGHFFKKSMFSVNLGGWSQSSENKAIIPCASSTNAVEE